MQLTKRKNDDGDDYDPATLARIKTLEKGRQGSNLKQARIIVSSPSKMHEI